jgi:hypothetical protein
VDTARDGILVASPRRVDDTRLTAALERLAALARDGDETATLALLQDLVADYQPWVDEAAEGSRAGAT